MTVRLVVSDVDGTIVLPDKSVAPSTVAAAARLQAAGVPLAIVSARPPRGMRYVVDALSLDAPYAGFNGGMLVRRDGTVVEWNPADPETVRQALDLFRARGVDAWLFTQDEWLVPDAAAQHVAHEEHTIRFAPRVVDDYTPYLDQVGKLVGVSGDFDHLARVEQELQALVGDRATAHRSQNYYLDLTHPHANKGYAVRALARHQGVETSEVAALGDMVNDVPMFTVAGFSVCMGNGSPEAKAAASAVTAANDHDGWAQAIDTLILPRTTAGAA